MKYTRLSATLVTVWLACCPVFGQSPPPNDNFTNRIVLTGTDVTFSGTTAGATIELPQESSVLGNGGTQSVWWAWTAPTTTTLTLQVLGSSIDQIQNQSHPDTLVIFSGTDGISYPTNMGQLLLGGEPIYFRLSPVTISLPVVAGSNYVILLVGSHSAAYTFRLLATNTPMILEQPQSRTVYSNSSALFYVIAADINQTNLTFQWRYNGSDLPGETAPMLDLTNIIGNMAGDYSVVVSNIFGATTSQVATLTVSQSVVPISLAMVGLRSNCLSFALSGEKGRMYRIQSSTDLHNWVTETAFPTDPFWPASTSIVLNSNVTTVLTVTNNAQSKFFRVTPYILGSPDAEICVNNLREIRIAKILWQRDSFGHPGQGYPLPFYTPLSSSLAPYLPHHINPVCPDDTNQTFNTSYFLHTVSINPACNIQSTNHLLEEPR